MKDDLGGKGAGLAEMTNAGLPVPPGFTIQTEACREYMRTNGVSTEVERQMDAALEQAGRAAGPEAGQGRESAAGERALGREVLHARHDGHHPQPRPQRPERRSAGQAQQQSALRLRLLPPLDPDVRQRRARHPEARFRRSVRRQEEAEEGQARYRPRRQGAEGSDRRIQEARQEAHQAATSRRIRTSSW